MAESNEMKAADLMERATKRTRSWSLFGNNTQKFEDAAELFAKAANHYKIAKNCNSFFFSLQKKQNRF